MIFWGSSLNSACQTLTVIRIRWQHKKDVFLGATWCSIIGLSIILNSSKKSVVPSKEAIKTTPKTSFTPNTHDIIATPLPRQQSYDASMGRNGAFTNLRYKINLSWIGKYTVRPMYGMEIYPPFWSPLKGDIFNKYPTIRCILELIIPRVPPFSLWF